MKNLKYFVMLFAMAASFVACDNNDDLLEDVTDGETALYDAEIIVTEDGIANVTEASIDITNNFDLKVKVTFKADEKNLRRLYVTENVMGEGVSLYRPNVEYDDKGDGSIDLASANKKEFVFIIPIEAPQSVEDGTVEYKFWTTSNRGDFRDMTKNLALGPATLTLNYGSKINAAAPVKNYTAKLLHAPLADKTSKTFISLLNGEVYRISEGAEYVAYWDFGFLYGATTQAGLYSVSNYPSSGMDVASVLEDGDVLNVTKFKKSNTVTEAEYDAIANSSDLDFIDANAITATKVQYLEVGDVIEFVDNYGKKGLIKVIGMVKSMGSDGYIKIDVKMQA